MATPSVRWLWWVPVGLAAIYLLLILTHLPALIGNAWNYSDDVIDGVMAKLNQTGASGWLSTGDFAHDETIAFALLLRNVPGYRTLLECAPLVFALAGSAALYWSVKRAFGAWQAAVVVGALVCIGIQGLTALLAFDWHGNSIVTAAICGAGCVWVLPRIDEHSNRRLACLAIVLGTLGGLPLAGDSLYVAWGLVPVVAVTVLSAWRGPRRLAGRVLVFGLGTAILTCVVAALFAALMRDDLRITSDTISHRALTLFFTPAGLITNFETLISGISWLATSPFSGLPVDFATARVFGCTALVFAAFLAVPFVLRRNVAAAQERPPSGGAEAVSARFVHAVFWAAVLATGVLIFVIGTPWPAPPTGRYLLGPYVAVGALLPVLLDRGLGWKLVVVACVSAFALGASIQFLDAPPPSVKGYTTEADAIARYAARERVRVGYAFYADSLWLTWWSNFRIDVFPLASCPTNTGVTAVRTQPIACDYKGIANSNWYTPRRGVRTMLLLRPGVVPTSSLRMSLGRPIASTTISGLQITVYPYDIASRMGSNSDV